MKAPDTPIAVVPVGKVSPLAAKSIAAHVIGYLDVAADILAPLEHPAYAYDERRTQYNAALILRRLDAVSFQGYDRVIALLDLDLFVPILTYVFGEARQGGRCALVSLYRLKVREDSPRAGSLAVERAAKVALHELGHLYNLHHCADEGCLMHFSGALEDLDRTPLYCCRYCAFYFREAFSARSQGQA